MQPLVSICIPTFNRADCLKTTIESIICQPEFQSGEVEIVVSDNTSTDATGEVCRQYAGYSNFFYHRNPENIRDRNYPTVLSESHGKLRKLNNDTYVLNEGALKVLCGLVRKYDETRPMIYLRGTGQGTREMDFRRFVVDTGYWITFIASFAIWDDDCEGIETDTEGCELLLWQVKKAFAIAYQKNTVAVCYQDLGHSIVPPKKDVSYGLYKVFYRNYMQLLEPYLANGALQQEDKEALEKRLLFDFFPEWLIRLELNNSEMRYSKEEDLKAAVWNQYQDKPYWEEFLKFYKKKLTKAKVKQPLKKLLGKA